ncbi:MAG: ClbS/DfsB family four-helix bundle protein [Lachnospiraceae bacterium]|nr:ClbS/DfsB family four-helix bundle protein [Lachnospiraceae bacterium]
MPRPQSKNDLIEAANSNYDKLLNLIDSMSEIELNTEFDFSSDIKKKEAHWKRDKNLRDILVHLHEWHNLMLEWVANNRSGIQKPFLMEGYNWKTYGDMNLLFWRRNQTVTLDIALEQFKESHKKIMSVIQTMSNDELFKKNVYEWVGGSTIGSYFISVTSSHYDWAMKKLKAHKRRINTK